MSKESKLELRPEVQKFAEDMERRLRANEHKNGWKDCDDDFLYNELARNVNLLDFSLAEGITAKHETLRRCANIGNFAMMIADNWGGLMESDR